MVAQFRHTEDARLHQTPATEAEKSFKDTIISLSDLIIENTGRSLQ